MRPVLDAAPLLLRLGGLPADSMDAFSSGLGEHIHRMLSLEAELAARRAELVDRLYQAISGQPEELRRSLLAVKRDCFNGRPLEKYRQTALWPRIQDIEGLSDLLAREKELAIRKGELGKAYERHESQEHETLRKLLQDPLFVCGLAVASPLIAERTRKLRRKPRKVGRKQRRLETTLLRYASRAALKLSPFSTFTPVGLAELSAAPATPERLAPTAPKPRSLVRMRRHILDRCADILRLYPPLREKLEIVLNDSRTLLPENRVLYLRPAHWALDTERSKLAFQEEALVQVGLDGDLVATFEELFSDRSWTYGALVRHLDDSLGQVGAGLRLVDRLVEVGFLLLPTPWDDDEGHLEVKILEELETLPAASEVTTFRQLLEEAVELQQGLLDHPRPEEAVTRLMALIDPTLEAARPLGSLGEATVTNRVSLHDIYQDTFIEAGSRTSLLGLSRTTAEGLVQDIWPIARLTRLFDHRHELLETLGHLLKRDHPGEERGFLEFFEEVRPYFLDYMKFQVRTREGKAWKSTWNPLSLESLTRLSAFRQEMAGSLGALGEDVPGSGRHIDGGRLDARLDQISERYTRPLAGVCLFLQPASGDGSRWMVNRIKEGTGRFSSRYTPVMDASSRKRYLDRLTPRGTVELEGETVELLDIWSAQGDTLNVHAAQTPKVLCYPGMQSRLPRNRRRSLGDLVVRPGAGGRAEIRDREGGRLLPVHLGVGYADYMPTLVKFLCAFGPSEMSAVFPPPWRQRTGDLVVTERTHIGRLILQRRSWTVGTAPIRETLGKGGELEIFEALNRWRLGLGIPDRCFFLEEVGHSVASGRVQPQYMDFSSPAFSRLLTAALKSSREAITFVEQLPRPEHFPVAAEGRPRAIELLLDSIAFVDSEPQRHIGEELPLPALAYARS